MTQQLQNSNTPSVIVNTETGEYMGAIGNETLDASEAIPMNAKFSRAVTAYVHEAFSDTPLPLHLAMLENMGLDDGDKLMLIEAWDSCQTITLKEFAAEFSGKNIQVLGVRIYEQGPFKSKETGATMPGFYAPQILCINPETKKRVRVRTSAPLISQIVFYTGRKHGFWFFDSPLTYQFKLTKDGSLQMEHIYEAGQESLEQRFSKLSRGKGAK